jgi:tetratricopeptide (TPR) repeat protein
LLSVFPATFDAAAEEVVCADAGHVQLSDLVRRSLVLYDDGTKRYRLHDLARLFADAKLSAEERAVGQKRFATHYKNVLAAAKELYKEGGESLLRGLALFDLEWGNIQSGHAWVAAQADAADADVDQLGIAYPDAGAHVLHLRQHSRERISWLDIALATARRLQDRAGEGVALGSLGLAYADLGETRRAIQFHEQALPILREIGDCRGEGAVLGNLGLAYADLGETSRAIQFYEQDLAIAREIGDRRGEGSVLGNLGLAYANLGETHRAIQFHEQALLIDREIGNHRGEGSELGNLGNAYADLGEITRAIQCYEQQLAIVREVGDRRGEGIALWNMSLALDQLGELAQAIQHAEQSLTIREQIEDRNAAKVRAQLAAWREQTNS